MHFADPEPFQQCCARLVDHVCNVKLSFRDVLWWINLRYCTSIFMYQCNFNQSMTGLVGRHLFPRQLICFFVLALLFCVFHVIYLLFLFRTEGCRQCMAILSPWYLLFFFLFLRQGMLHGFFDIIYLNVLSHFMDWNRFI